ncbi:hypothetical protein EHP00_654 [Ecytonucleospora hepatopenaei]|uniref:Uncharacterized protein n=1 Tax=Ecytonucleospora hepatopenaei TaxID=646526 RepID=A0A1W0E857_9MICR|nr:hypothetical protein EHP00_654 [Ecytonucleospora hepatopenaei]
MFNYLNGFYRKIKNTLFKDKIRKSYTELLAILRRTTPLTHADIYKIQTIMFELHGEPALVRRKFRALKDAIEYKKLMKDKAIFENDVSYGVNGSIVKGHINSEEEEEYIKNIAPAIKLSENENNNELEVVEENTIHNLPENIRKCEKHCLDCYKAQVRNEIKQEIEMENRAKTEEKRRRVRRAKIRNMNRFNPYNERLGLPRVLGMSIADEYFNVNDLDSEDKEAYDAWVNIKRIKTENTTKKQNEILENKIEEKESRNETNIFNTLNINDNNILNKNDQIKNNIFNNNINDVNTHKEDVSNPFLIKNNDDTNLITTKVLVEDDKKDSNIFKTEQVKNTNASDIGESKIDSTGINAKNDNVFNIDKSSNFSIFNKNDNDEEIKLENKSLFDHKEKEENIKEEKNSNVFNTQNIVEEGEKDKKIETNPFSTEIATQNKFDGVKNNEVKNLFGNNQSNFSSTNVFQNDVKSNSVFQNDIKSNSVFQNDIKSNSVFQNDINSNSVFQNDINSNSVFQNDINSNFTTNNSNVFNNNSNIFNNNNTNANLFGNNLFNNTNSDVFNSKSDISNPFDISKMPDNSDSVPQFNPFANTANNPFSNAQNSWDNKNKSEETETTSGFRRRRARRR